MLSFQNLSLRRGPRLLFQDVSLAIFPGQKVGIIGANGAGKSSLFALILHQLESDAGELRLPQDWVIAHVAQETPALGKPAIEYVIDGDRELRTIEAELEAAEQAGQGTAIATLHAKLEAVDGYTARSRAARLMHGLGFEASQEELPVNDFSGGWRMRLNLAQALMTRSDLLLLDEPTNHLDLDAVIWLQDWLRAYPGTLLLISHDRDFLDLVADHIARIGDQTVELYSGNYTAYERRRAENLARQQAVYEKQQRDVAHIQSYVARFRAQATKARQAQSRLKALERMELVAPAHVDSPFHFAFRPPEKLPTMLLALDRVEAGYGDRRVLRGIKLELLPGHRIGLLGRNGAGKSTLVKLLAGELPALAGERVAAKDLRVGYFAQHQLEQLHLDGTPLSHLQRLDPKAAEQDLRNFIGGFGFHGDMALAPVAPFSGGEKARLVLALLVYQRPNLLLLDEPTNHLDLEMRHALAMALQDFEGAMVVVSHDRHLLRTVADQFLLVADGDARPFEGDLEDYRRWLLESANLENDSPRAAEDDPAHSAGARKERRRQEAEQRKRLQPLRAELQRVEKAIDRCNDERADIETRLADPAMYAEQAKPQLKELLLAKAKLDQALAEAEEAWLRVSEELESLG